MGRPLETAPGRFELPSQAPKARMLGHYTTGLRPKNPRLYITHSRRSSTAAPTWLAAVSAIYGWIPSVIRNRLIAITHFAHASQDTPVLDI